MVSCTPFFYVGGRGGRKIQSLPSGHPVTRRESSTLSTVSIPPPGPAAPLPSLVCSAQAPGMRSWRTCPVARPFPIG